MSRISYCTAATLRAVLQYIDPEEGPKIAYDNDSLAEPLIEKVNQAVGKSHGSQRVSISFSDEEAPLERQFAGVLKQIQQAFTSLFNIYQA